MTALISRVADHCFWFGRYLERAEATARTLSVTQTTALGAESTLGQIWLPVIIVAGEEERFGELVGMEHAEDGERVEHYMTWGERCPSSIASSVRALRENARAMREQVSLETWHTINQLHVWLGSKAAAAEFEDDRHAFYGRVRRSMDQVHGLLSTTMLHDTPLDFIWLGAFLERANQTARILDVHHHANTLQPVAAADVAVWIGFLRALGSYETYMKRKRSRVTVEGVIDFLVSDPDCPRSVLHCLRQAAGRLSEIRPPEEVELPGAGSVARLGALERWVSGRNGTSIVHEGVHEVLTHVVDEVHEICVQIGQEFLGYASAA